MAGETMSYGSMTSAGISCFYNASINKEDPRVADAFRWLCEHYTLDENPNVKKKGLFHYYYTLAKALDSYGVNIITDSHGKEHGWQEELACKLSDLQHNEGFWVNECQEWWEGNRTLMTSYAILTLSYLC
jgi:squalene-hopene/tetraprenyl-beta-curcumene cyclase